MLSENLVVDSCSEPSWLDEPLSFLDRAYKQSFEALLEALVPEETTMLMVTHDIAGSGAGAWQELKLDEYAR